MLTTILVWTAIALCLAFLGSLCLLIAFARHPVMAEDWADWWFTATLWIGAAAVLTGMAYLVLAFN